MVAAGVFALLVLLAAGALLLKVSGATSTILSVLGAVQYGLSGLYIHKHFVAVLGVIKEG